LSQEETSKNCAPEGPKRTREIPSDGGFFSLNSDDRVDEEEAELTPPSPLASDMADTGSDQTMRVWTKNMKDTNCSFSNLAALG